MKTGNDNTKPDIKHHDFIVSINDGFCEWEFTFNLNGKHCINDLVTAIEYNLKTKRISEVCKSH